MPIVPVTLDHRHADVLEQIAREQDMSKTAVMRQALRLYQMVYERQKAGEQLAFTKNGVVVPQILIGPRLMEDPTNGT